MDTATSFTTGRSQAVRLPKAYRFNVQKVAIKHFGNGVLLLPVDNPWQIMEEAVYEFEEGFVMLRGSQERIQREEFL